MFNLQGKSVLFIGPQTFGYEIEIMNEMRRQGADVDFLPDRPFKSPFMKAVIRVRREWVLPLADRFVMNAVEAFGRASYDLIFVIGGEGLSVRSLPWLRTSFPTATFVLYLWDSLKNKRLLYRNLPFFDRCVTFDPKDAKVFGMKFRPLFYSPGFVREANVCSQYHLSFIGTAHSDRYKIVSNLLSILPENIKFYRYLYLQAPWMYWIHKLGNSAYRGASIDEFCFSPMKKADVQSIFFDSLSVLDIEHPSQLGLTMRTFETLGACKKLITTNENIRETDFYNENNILVIDRFNIEKIPESFFNTPYIPLSEDIYKKYSISKWLDDALPAESKSGVQ
jgi:hypothetical protein